MYVCMYIYTIYIPNYNLFRLYNVTLMYVFRADLLASETLANKSKADFSEVLIFSFHFFTALLTSLLYSVCGLLFHVCVIFFLLL